MAQTVNYYKLQENIYKLYNSLLIRNLTEGNKLRPDT